MQQYLPFTVLKLKGLKAHTKLASVVATVLTVYGIETFCFKILQLLSELQQYLPFTVLKHNCGRANLNKCYRLQQYLPFTVLKLSGFNFRQPKIKTVATVLTVYGIETNLSIWLLCILRSNVATVLTVYGIETVLPDEQIHRWLVATVLTVYGIETQVEQ